MRSINNVKHVLATYCNFLHRCRRHSREYRNNGGIQGCTCCPGNGTGRTDTWCCGTGVWLRLIRRHSPRCRRKPKTVLRNDCGRRTRTRSNGIAILWWCRSNPTGSIKKRVISIKCYSVRDLNECVYYERRYVLVSTMSAVTLVSIIYNFYNELIG